MEGDAMRDLYSASLNGCVSTLKTLIQRDPLILSKVSLYPFYETPLHMVSLLGHLEFCQVLLDTYPSFAAEVNSEGRCPLHLASAKGHTEIVQALLLTNPETCLIRDKDDKLPLHFAAMRGRVGAIKELINTRPDSIQEMIESDNGSILHLCVCYNHLEALKLLVESVRGDTQFLSAMDKEGNTVLHLAIRGRQSKIIEYLLSLSEMSTTINTSNRMGLTPMDMLRSSSRDFTALRIQPFPEEGDQGSTDLVIVEQPISTTPRLTEQVVPLQSIATEQQDPLLSNNPLQSAQPSTSNNPSQPSPSTTPCNSPPQRTQPSPRHDPQQQPPSSPNIDPSSSSGPLQPTQASSSSNDTQQPQLPPSSIANEQHEFSRWDIFENFCTTYLISQDNWVGKRTREQWMVAATVIATMTFQSVISPPGGVWQADTTDGGYACPDYGFCEAGTAVVGYVWSPDFLKFVFFNSTSFFASLCVVLVLVSGFPLENKVIMWILAVLMLVAITCMLLTYMWALGLVCPNHVYYRIRDLGYLLTGTWSVLLFLVGLIHTTRILFWVRSRRRSSTNNVALSQLNT